MRLKCTTLKSERRLQWTIMRCSKSTACLVLSIFDRRHEIRSNRKKSQIGSEMSRNNPKNPKCQLKTRTILKANWKTWTNPRSQLNNLNSNKKPTENPNNPKSQLRNLNNRTSWLKTRAILKANWITRTIPKSNWKTGKILNANWINWKVLKFSWKPEQSRKPTEIPEKCQLIFRTRLGFDHCLCYKIQPKKSYLKA